MSKFFRLLCKSTSILLTTILFFNSIQVSVFAEDGITGTGTNILTESGSTVFDEQEAELIDTGSVILNKNPDTENSFTGKIVLEKTGTGDVLGEIATGVTLQEKRKDGEVIQTGSDLIDYSGRELKTEVNPSLMDTEGFGEFSKSNNYLNLKLKNGVVLDNKKQKVFEKINNYRKENKQNEKVELKINELKEGDLDVQKKNKRK